jgi:hypothetical protein
MGASESEVFVWMAAETTPRLLGATVPREGARRLRVPAPQLLHEKLQRPASVWSRVQQIGTR